MEVPSSDDQAIADLRSALNEVIARQKQLEERLARLEQPGSITPQLAKADDLQPTVSEQIFPVEQAVIAPPEVEPLQAEQPAFESRLGLTILNRVGVITLVLGVGFFFKWAVDNNWVGPWGRVLLGLVAGLLTLGIADTLWRKAQQVFAQGITGTGIAIIYIAFYAAFDFYHLIGQPVAFLLLLATTVMAAALALRYNAIAIEALGFVGAYLIPLLLSTGEDHPWFLMTYLLVINISATALARRRKWQLLELLSFLATVLIFGAWLFEYGGRPADHWPATAGILLLCAQRFTTTWPTLFLLAQALTALCVPYIWHGSLNAFWLSMVIAAGGLAFAYKRHYASVAGTAFLAFWLAAAFSVFQEHTPTQSMLFLALGFLLFAAWSWWQTPTEVNLGIFALNGAFFYLLAYSTLQPHHHSWLGPLAFLLAVFYLALGRFLQRSTNLTLLCLGLCAAFLALAIPIQFTGFTITIAWSIEAAALSWLGVRFSNRRPMIAAFVLFGLAVFHVIFIDGIASAATLLLNTRFLSFASLGAAFLLSAYWSRRAERRFALIDFLAGHIVLLIGLTLEVIDWATGSAHAENMLSVETISITILFASYALILVSIGVATRSGVNRFAGLGLTGIAIIKLYVYDVWQLSRIYQIIAFVILGVLLLATSFLYSRFKNLISEWRKDTAEQ